MGLIRTLLELYTYAIIARILLSYFPISPGGAMAQFFSVLYAITEPVLGPVRRMIPAVGMFDFSPMVVIIVLQVLANRF